MRGLRPGSVIGYGSIVLLAHFGLAKGDCTKVTTTASLEVSGRRERDPNRCRVGVLVDINANTQPMASSWLQSGPSAASRIHQAQVTVCRTDIPWRVPLPPLRRKVLIDSTRL